METNAKDEEDIMLTIRTVLHATDFSETAGFASRIACSLARDYRARLVLLHVVPPPVIGYAEGMIIPDNTESIENARCCLEQIQPKDSTVLIERRVTEGDPASEIVWNADEVHADVIVLGTHGRAGLARLVMGSVAENVMRHASCAVLTVKNPLHQRRAVEAPATAIAAH